MAEEVVARGRAGLQPPGWWDRFRQMLPEGRALPAREWQARHQVIEAIIWGHAIGLAAGGLSLGLGAPMALGEGAVIAALAALAAVPTLSQRFRSSVAALAMVTSSAVLVQFSGGLIEAHFHYFIVISIVSLYQDWVPFLLGILYVGLDHGIVGSLAPGWVYNHHDGLARPWKWAAIHASLVLAQCSALMVAWRANERSRAHAELVLRSTGEGILGLALDGRITFANPEATKLAGRAETELVGEPAWKLFARDLSRPSAGSPPVGEEAVLHRPDGRQVPVEVVSTPVVFRHEVLGSVVAVKDISERKEDEADLLRLNARLQEADRLKGQFMNAASHELRTPLTPLLLQLQLLAAHPDMPEGRRQLGMATALRSAERLSGLVADMLDVARLQTGGAPLVLQPADLGDILAQVTAGFAEAARAQGVEVVQERNGPAPVGADASRLGQAFHNLVANALRTTPEGGRITLSARCESGMVTAWVHDTGAGFDSGELADLFHPFGSSGLVRPPVERSSGLGLYLAQEVVAGHGGRIWATSAGPGRGTTLHVALPMAQAETRGLVRA